MLKVLIAAASIAALAPVAQGAESFTIIYLDPNSPATSYFIVAELPSFLFGPGAPILWSSPQARVSSSGSTPVGFNGGELDCSNFSGSVSVGAYDPNGLDADHDGIGCEWN